LKSNSLKKIMKLEFIIQ